ncbi:mitochondrial ribosomal protein L37-domain-containing protein, partial [Boletus edulis BED1]
PHSNPSRKKKDAASSCPAGTIMTGLNYLKGEPPILAKPDEEYPAWLWELTKPRQLVDDGPGGKAEKRGLRLTHRQTLKDNNMFKAK